MVADLKITRLVATSALIALIGLLMLQALGYGIGFALDPAAGVGEFGSPQPAVVDDLTVSLVGMVGVSMLGTAALLTLAAILVWRKNPAGVLVTAMLGAGYVLVGMSAFRAEWGWDGYFYVITGVALIVLSAVVGWLQARQRDTISVGGP